MGLIFQISAKRLRQTRHIRLTGGTRVRTHLCEDMGGWVGGAIEAGDTWDIRLVQKLEWYPEVSNDPSAIFSSGDFMPALRYKTPSVSKMMTPIFHILTCLGS